MYELYLRAIVSINEEEISFTSDRPYEPKGCYKCGKYRDMPYGNQASSLDYFKGRFLCDDCYPETIPGGATSKINHFREIYLDLRDKYILKTINLDG